MNCEIILHRRNAGEHQDLLRILTEEHTQNQEVVNMAASIIELSEQRGLQQGIEQGERRASIESTLAILNTRFPEAEADTLTSALEAIEDINRLKRLNIEASGPWLLSRLPRTSRRNKRTLIYLLQRLFFHRTHRRTFTRYGGYSHGRIYGRSFDPTRLRTRSSPCQVRGDLHVPTTPIHTASQNRSETKSTQLKTLLNSIHSLKVHSPRRRSTTSPRLVFRLRETLSNSHYFRTRLISNQELALPFRLHFAKGTLYYGTRKSWCDWMRCYREQTSRYRIGGITH